MAELDVRSYNNTSRISSPTHPTHGNSTSYYHHFATYSDSGRHAPKIGNPVERALAEKYMRDLLSKDKRPGDFVMQSLLLWKENNDPIPPCILDIIYPEQPVSPQTSPSIQNISSWTRLLKFQYLIAGFALLSLSMFILNADSFMNGITRARDTLEYFGFVIVPTVATLLVALFDHLWIASLLSLWLAFLCVGFSIESQGSPSALLAFTSTLFIFLSPIIRLLIKATQKKTEQGAAVNP